MRRWIAVMVLVLLPTFVHAQEAKRPVPQQGSEPNYGTGRGVGTGPGGQEVRPGSPDGDAPSASAGRLRTDPTERRIFGLPVTAVLVLAAVILGVLALAGVVLPSARRRARARGNGTYGPGSSPTSDRDR